MSNQKKVIDKNNLKEELILLLIPIFGESIKMTILEYYDNDKPKEILNLAHPMLSGYMGEENADKLLDTLFKKFPEVEK